MLALIFISMMTLVTLFIYIYNPLPIVAALVMLSC